MASSHTKFSVCLGGYKRGQSQRSRHQGQLLAQVCRAHGHGDIRALLDIRRPLQNPQPTFSPASLCLRPFYYMNSLPPFHHRLCLCLSVALPLSFLKSPSSSLMETRVTEPIGKESGQKSQGIPGEGV